jgi:hypothetical protein
MSLQTACDRACRSLSTFRSAAGLGELRAVPRL